MSAEDLERIADRLDMEARHWQEHPDYFTPKRDSYEGMAYKDAFQAVKSFMDANAVMHRATHTDIVLRDLAYQLRRIAKSLGASDDV